jgi:hypothetical protein
MTDEKYRRWGVPAFVRPQAKRVTVRLKSWSSDRPREGDRVDEPIELRGLHERMYKGQP